MDYLGEKRKFKGEIKATAPTPQDWIELVRENERLRARLERKTKQMRKW